LIETYTNTEWKVLTFFLASTVAMIFLLIFSVLVFDLNKTKLIFIDFCLTISECQTFSGVWFMNFFYQFITVVLGMFIFFGYFGTVFMLISHACFKVDSVIVTVKQLRKFCEHKKMNVKYWRIYNQYFIKKYTRKALMESLDTRNFIEMAQSYIAATVLADTLILCIMVCMTLFAITKSDTNLLVCTIGLMLSSSQLYIYNFSGQRLQNKLDELVDAVYDLPWYNMHFMVQRDILFILMSLQKFRGLHGIFFFLSHETFYKVRISKRILDRKTH
jgi:7tm Odorant receptor